MRDTCIRLTVAALGGAAGWFCALPARRAAEFPPAERAPAAAARDGSGAAAAAASAGFLAMTPADLKARLEAILASPGRDSQELQRLMLRWVSVDLEGAKAWIRAYPDSKSAADDPGSRPVRDFFKAWAELDPVAAMAEADALSGEGAKSSTARDAVIEGLARADFAVITEILSAVSDTYSVSRGAMARLWKQLMIRDRPAALALAMSLRGGIGDGAVEGAAAVWARTDPQGALAWVREYPGESTRDHAAEAILMEWARRDPVSAGPFLLQKREGSPELFHAAAAAEAVARLSATSPAAAAEFVAKFYPPDRLRANLNSLFRRMMREDAGNPQAAAAMCACVNLLPEEALKSAKLWQGSWPSDLGPSWERILAEPDSPGRRLLLGEIGRKFSAQNPARLISDVMRLTDPAAQEELLRASFSEGNGFQTLGGEKELAEIRQAVESMPESVRSLGAAHLAWSMAARDPMAAAEVIRQYPAAAESADLIENMAGRMAGRIDITAAQHWADSLPTPAAVQRGYSGIVSGHYDADSGATSLWVESLPPGPGRDSAAGALANHAKEDDPEAAFAWAVSVRDEKIRGETAQWVLQSWAAADPAAATRALEQSALPEDRKTALRTSLFAPR